MVYNNCPDPRKWSVADVCAWVCDHSYKADTVRALAENEVDGATLLTLTPADLRDEIKVKALSERRRLIADIAVLQGFAFVRNGQGRKEYVETKRTVAEIEDDGFMEESLRAALQAQVAEVKFYESVLDDHAVASRTQSEFNGLFLTEEKDEIVAKAVGNVTDERATILLRDANSALEREHVIERNDGSAIVAEVQNGEAGKLDTAFESLTLENYHRSGEEFKEFLEPTNQALTMHIFERNAADDVLMNCTVCRHSMTRHDRAFAIQAPCGDSYCKSCMRDWLTSSLSDVTLLPMKCCRQALPQNVVFRLSKELLTPQLADTLQRRTMELLCVNSMYCPGTNCSTFIDLDKAEQFLLPGLTFKCPSKTCSVILCFECKTAAHETSCAVNKERIQQEGATTEASLRRLGYQRCPGCSAFVELIYGCNHMTCHCKAEFCYDCGAEWNPRRCTCDLLNLRRIEQQEARLVPAHIVGPARIQAVAARVEAVRENIYREEMCTHAYVTRTDEYEERRNKPRCSLCDRRLNLFGYKCNDCPRSLCIGCYKHR